MDAKVQFARFELTGTITFGATDKIAIERATLLFDQENVFPLKDGITYRIKPSVFPMAPSATRLRSSASSAQTNRSGFPPLP
jgi:hypothetical protein